jgi:DNA-binding transcriptional ArsR family regulator
MNSIIHERKNPADIGPNQSGFMRLYGFVPPKKRSSDEPPDVRLVAAVRMLRSDPAAAIAFAALHDRTHPRREFFFAKRSAVESRESLETISGLAKTTLYRALDRLETYGLITLWGRREGEWTDSTRKTSTIIVRWSRAELDAASGFLPLPTAVADLQVKPRPLRPGLKPPKKFRTSRTLTPNERLVIGALLYLRNIQNLADGCQVTIRKLADLTNLFDQTCSVVVKTLEEHNIICRSRDEKGKPFIKFTSPIFPIRNRDTSEEKAAEFSHQESGRAPSGIGTVTIRNRDAHHQESGHDIGGENCGQLSGAKEVTERKNAQETNSETNIGDRPPDRLRPGGGLSLRLLGEEDFDKVFGYLGRAASPFRQNGDTIPLQHIDLALRPYAIAFAAIRLFDRTKLDETTADRFEKILAIELGDVSRDMRGRRPPDRPIGTVRSRIDPKNASSRPFESLCRLVFDDHALLRWAQSPEFLTRFNPPVSPVEHASARQSFDM